MSMHICGTTPYPVQMPLVAGGECCPGAILDGPQGCTCWTSRYDTEQQEPSPGPAALPPGMCADCAFRPGSPERSGEDGYQANQEELDELVMTGQPFHCHAGMRRRVAWVHPSGAEVAGHPADYVPPVRDGVPYKADGSPADRCAGWAARRRAFLQQTGATS